MTMADTDEIERLDEELNLMIGFLNYAERSSDKKWIELANRLANDAVAARMRAEPETFLELPGGRWALRLEAGRPTKGSA
jgi:hypothetical protein